jgi:hypothetical protein
VRTKRTADLVVVREILTPVSEGLSYSAVSAGMAGRPTYHRSGQWAVRCFYPACGDTRDGKIVSIDVVHRLSVAVADQHRAQHEHESAD